MDNRTVGTDIPFERVRRITGYLVGTLERWGNAKRAEERDRVKHMAADTSKEIECPNHDTSNPTMHNT